MGMGLGPIPHSKIRDYGKDYGFRDLMLDAFIRIIRAMDNKFMSWYTKEQENKTQK